MAAYEKTSKIIISVVNPPGNRSIYVIPPYQTTEYNSTTCHQQFLSYNQRLNSYSRCVRNKIPLKRKTLNIPESLTPIFEVNLKTNHKDFNSALWMYELTCWLSGDHPFLIDIKMTKRSPDHQPIPARNCKPLGKVCNSHNSEKKCPILLYSRHSSIVARGDQRQ